jgi:DivIVA domain-containing protein
MNAKEQDMAEAQPIASPEPAPGTRVPPVSPLDIQQKEFRVSRFGGYKMRDVDEFLDQITDGMTAVLADNERLRRGAPPAAPVVGTPDLDDVGRQADEIIQRARDEAARIVAEARERAATIGAGGAVAAATAPADRAAINAFLAREKEFLQSLAGLVQGHAEGVRSIAREARAASAPESPAGETTAPAAPDPAAAPAAPTRQPPPPVATAKPPNAAQPMVSIPKAEEPVRVEEPEPAGARRSESADPSADDASLRELFWGED